MGRCEAKTRTGRTCGQATLPNKRACRIAAHQLQMQAGPTGATRSSHWMAWVGIGLTLLVAAGQFYRSQMEQWRAASNGTLSPRIASSVNVERFSVGARSFRVQASEGLVFRDANEELLRVRTDEGRLLVSARFLDEEGALIAQLVDNEWGLNRNRYFDRNYTQNALEVVDQKGRVALQLVHGGNTINVEGIFRCREGRHLVMMHSPKTSEGIFILGRKGMPDPLLSPASICRYPAAAHFQECPGVADVERIMTKYVPRTLPPGGLGEGTWDITADFCNANLPFMGDQY